MLKHSITHYGTTSGASLAPLTSSIHSTDTSPLQVHQLPTNYQQNIQQAHFHHFSQQGSGGPDATKFIESPHHHHSHAHQSFVEQQSYGGVHNSRLHSSSRRSRDRSKEEHGQHASFSQMNTPTTPPQSKMNGSIFFTSPQSQNNNPDVTLLTNATNITHSPGSGTNFRQGVLKSLALLSILSLLLALTSLIFLLKIVWPLNMSGGGSSEFKLMYEVTLCLAAMCLSINLCVLLVTSAQYFFAISGSPGTTSFLQKVTIIRGVATGGFFLSIPLFLAAIVLYTFTHLSFAVPALVTTAIVGLAIIFGGCAMVYHVFTWQKEKTSKTVLVQDVSPNPTIELSTLV